MLYLRHDLVEDTFRALRTCGAGARECVAYWSGPIDHPAIADRIVQPVHTAGRAGYDVDDQWVNQFFLELRDGGRAVRAQIHTHPGRHVRHSLTDDAHAIAPSPGFTSVVLPFFATGPVGFEGAYVAVLNPDGRWREVQPEEALSWT